MLADVDSKAIGDFGILNTNISKDDAFLYGIPFPGTYIIDESGTVIAKFFHDSYKKRDSPERLIDAALGMVTIDETAPQDVTENSQVRITASIQGGNGSIRQGIVRQLVIRFELTEGLHIYSEPVPEGMIATTIQISGPDGLELMEPIRPPTERLDMPGVGTLHVWSGTVDIVTPFYPTGVLASETRPLDMESIDVEVNIRYQACTDTECLFPATEKLNLRLPLDVIDVPALSIHQGHGQREGKFSSEPAMRRLMLRKFLKNPIGFIRFLRKSKKMAQAARERRNSD